MKSEFDRLTAEATKEALGVAKEVEARATAKMTEDDRSNDSTETFSAGASLLGPAGDDFRLYSEPIHSIDASDRHVSRFSPDPDMSPPRSRKSASIFERTRQWLFGRPQPSSFPEKGSNLKSWLAREKGV